MCLGCRRSVNPGTIYSHARYELTQGFFEDALSEADQGYRRSGSDPVWAWKFKVLKAEILLRQGKPKDALALVSQDSLQGLPSDLNLNKGIVQGEALCQLSQGERAARIFHDLEQVMSPELRARLELAEGRCSMATDRALAKTHLSNAIQFAQGHDNFVEGLALLNLGFATLQDQRYDEALQQLRRAANVSDSLYVRERAFGNLGFVHSRLGDWRTAISYSQPAEELASRIQDKIGRERWLTTLGQAHFALWDLQEAATAYQQALSLAQELHDTENTALCLNNLTLLALRRHDISQADAYRKQGEALKVKSEALHFDLIDARISEVQGHLPEAERSLLDLLPRCADDPLLHFQVQRDLAGVYWQEEKHAQADELFRDGIAGAEETLSQLKRPEFRMSFMDQEPFYDSYIQFLVAQNKPLEALNIAERGRAQVLAAALDTNHLRTSAPLSAASLKAFSKQRGQSIVYYAMTDEKTFLWVITSSVFKVFELPGHYDLASQILSFNQEIQDHRDIGNSPSAVKLYQSLLQPAEEFLPQGSNVVIIPSKLLAMVNFEALIVPGPQPHYWIEDVDIQVAGSLALLRNAPTVSNGKVKARDRKELFALGAPVEAEKGFPPLKYAPAEMERVESHFASDERVFVSGPAAMPQAYRAHNPAQFRYIHLDTHGVSSDLNPLDSAIILSPGADGSYKLHAQEIKDIPLHADLVTISACYGAGTRWYQGEGIVGLAWAFLRAGAHQVIAALWEVDDASSPQLMDDFYGELTQGKSAAEALRDAKLKMLHSSDFHRHPYYWASLQLYTGS